jgi:hypothetical protein
MENLLCTLTAGHQVEERYRQIDGAIPSAKLPHRNKETHPIGIDGKWVASLPDLSMLLHTDSSKLDDGSSGSG